MKTLIIIFLFIIFFSSGIYSQEKDKSLINNPPKLSEYVTDETGTLSQEQLVYLRKKLRKISDSTSTQILVYMVSTLNDEPIDEAANSIARANKIGKKDKNNGLLLLIAKDDRKLRIEVGYGLEGVMTDAMSSQIIRKEITPNFKTGDYFKGIETGVDAIIATVKGEYQADVPTTTTNETMVPGISNFLLFLIILIPIGLISFFIFAAIYGAKKGYGVGGSNSSYYSDSSSSSSWSSSSDSSSSSSSSDDSSFSGGGGDFGGGGASGDW